MDDQMWPLFFPGWHNNMFFLVVPLVRLQPMVTNYQFSVSQYINKTQDKMTYEVSGPISTLVSDVSKIKLSEYCTSTVVFHITLDQTDTSG